MRPKSILVIVIVLTATTFFWQQPSGQRLVNPSVIDNPYVDQPTEFGGQLGGPLAGRNDWRIWGLLGASLLGVYLILNRVLRMLVDSASSRRDIVYRVPTGTDSSDEDAVPVYDPRAARDAD